MGASFHRADRDALLNTLDTLVAPTGAVVVASGGAPSDQSPPAWNDTITAIRACYLGAAPGPNLQSPGGAARRRASPKPLQPGRHRRPRDLDSVVGLEFSFSYSAPAQFGDEDTRARFEQDLREALTTEFPAGDFTENIRTEALIGTSP
jgi:hypothetical protein